MRQKLLRRTNNLLLLLFLLCICSCTASGPCALIEPRADATCIPLASINRAFNDAREFFGLKYPIEFPPTKAHHHLHEVDQLGMVLTLTSKYLANEFQLTKYQVDELLPQLDIELTDIWKFCPEYFRHSKSCKLSDYRSLDGRCNNVNFPEFGAANTPFRYLVPPDRPDMADYPKDPDSTYLPSARVVSSRIHKDLVAHDHSITVMLIAWGQLIDHDVTLTAETKDPHTGKDPDCCKYLYEGNDAKLHHNCFPILIPDGDEFYFEHHQKCMTFLRSYSGVRPKCRLGSRVAINSITSYIDASFVYGSNDALSRKLRTGRHGTLDSSPFFSKIGLKDLLPPKIEKPNRGCIRPNDDLFCFLAGDHRVNEQLVLTALHTLTMREHNRIAYELHRLNPHWEDEKLFQESRRIIIALTQHITYNEFLPMILGKSQMHENGLSIHEGHWNGYDSKVDPSASEEFITSAFRFGHSLLPNRIERWSYAHQFIDSTPLSKQIRQPFDLYVAGNMDMYLLGMVNQIAQAMDEGVTEQVTTLLFRKPHQHFGMDLAAMNIQRSRDHAVAGFAAMRKFCGLSPVKVWSDLYGIFRNETIWKYQAIYRSPEDIDLWSGGVSEIPIYGSLLGSTFSCIIAKQFQALRRGDRHWYELPDLPSSFTTEQLTEIKKTRLSRIVCDNSDHIKTIQAYSMMLPHPHKNPRVPCQGSVLPRIDLSKWKEEVRHGKLYHQDSPNIHHDENYATMFPPKYDARFVPLPGSPQNNITYETTNYSNKPPHYPNPTEYGEKEPEFDKAPEGYSPGPDPETEFHYIPYQDNTKGPEILENLEAPPGPLLEDEEEASPPPPPQNIPHQQEYSVPVLPNPSRRRIPYSLRPPFLHPQSPFPGLGGIFNPNPGYLVKHKLLYPPFHGQRG